MHKILKIEYYNTILFGNIYGTIPSLQVITQQKFKNIRCVILMNCLSEDIIIERNVNSYKYNIIDKLDVVKANVLIIHGKREDNQINLSQSFAIQNKLTNVYSWYPKNGNQYNIIQMYRSEFYLQIKGFLKDCFYKKLLTEKSKVNLKDFSLTSHN